MGALQRISRPFCLLLISIFLTGNSYCQVLVEARTWTGSNGKEIKAEMLNFGPEADEGVIRLRVRGGNIFKVKTESLSREDQALVLRARFDKFFRSRFSNSLNAHFFYSNQVPKSDEDNSIVAYIGNDKTSAWMRLKASISSSILRDGKAIIFDGISSGLVRIEYEEEDIEPGGRQSTLDLSLTKHAIPLSEIFSDPNGMQVIVEQGPKNYTEIQIDRNEQLAMKETSQAFLSLRNLTTDHVWWSTFQNLSPKEVEALKKELAPEPIRVRNPVSESEKELLPLQEWTLNKNEMPFMAKVVGFDRHKVLFRMDDLSTKAIPLEELSKEHRETLAICRMDHGLSRNWHPYDDQYRWYWPKSWPKMEERLHHQAILFAIDHENGKPKLILQQRFENDSAQEISSCKLVSAKVFLDVDLPTGNAMKLRSESSTCVWIPLNEDVAKLLTVAAPGMLEMEYEITPASGPVQSGKFTQQEFKASIEAIEIYRAWRSLLNED